MNSLSIPVSDSSHVSAARLGAQKLARDMGFDETRTGRVAIVVTEAVTNMLRHAQGGTLAARGMACGEDLGLEILAIDRGEGMDDFEHSARDGHSTAGTPGNGLGAIRRLSDEFDVYTRPGTGTILRMGFWPPGDRRAPHTETRYQIGSIAVPKPGEPVCGDAWGVVFTERGATFVVADGLGHGPEASRAAALAVDTLRRHPDHRPVELLGRAHNRLRPTRGAAVAVIRHDLVEGRMAFAGVGNISACVLDGEGRRAMVSHNGIVGHNTYRCEEYLYPWPAGALMVAHSDGLESRWSLADYPGLAQCHPSIIAGLLYRQHARGRDDACVVVARSIKAD